MGNTSCRYARPPKGGPTMPWHEVSAMSLRSEFVALARAAGANVRQLCRRFGVSPKTGYKWLARYALAVIACPDERTATVRGHLEAVFARYGLPERILCDNGPPWGNSQADPHTELSAWLLRLGVAVSHGRPCHPQTQGKDERFH